MRALPNSDDGFSKNGANKPDSVTIEDIARIAGVSRSTVSRVLNDNRNVSKKTRAKVQAVIEREGYVPDPVARAMVTRRTQVIGVVIPTTLGAVFADFAYFPTLLDGISEAAHARGYGMLLWVGSHSDDQELFQKRVLKNRLMDGLIIVSGTMTNQRPFIDQVMKLNIPLVLTERPTHRASQVSYVTIDNVQAAQNIVSHLINQGYKRIGHITGMMENIDGADRLTGYKNALQQARIPYDETLVVEGHFTRMSGYLGMKMLLERGVRAVFTASDLMADGAAQAINEAGLRVPDDIALVGFDDLPYASQMSPQLTTVRQPIQQKGTYAVNILLDMIEGAAESAQHVLLPTQLVIRESCGAVKTIA